MRVVFRESRTEDVTCAEVSFISYLTGQSIEGEFGEITACGLYFECMDSDCEEVFIPDISKEDCEEICRNACKNGYVDLCDNGDAYYL